MDVSKYIDAGVSGDLQGIPLPLPCIQDEANEEIYLENCLEKMSFSTPKQVQTEPLPLMDPVQRMRWYSIALWLAVFTIGYNLVEGLVATYFGYEDESLTLFGFGVDSFIELISGLGIAHMVIRVRRNPVGNRDAFERTALRITGTAFYLLVVGLTVSAVYHIWIGHKPVATTWGVIISLISIAVMLGLIYGKTKAGRALNSEAILADARCTRVCIYMSVVLLVSSGIYALTQIGYIDSLGTLGLAYFSFTEGKECFEKANSDAYCSCDDDES